MFVSMLLCALTNHINIKVILHKMIKDHINIKATLYMMIKV